MIHQNFLEQDLKNRLHGLSSDLQVQVLCEFKFKHFQQLPTQVTEIILKQCYELSKQEGDQQYDLGIVAYGKLGARELNESSDLDLVFLYDDQNKQNAISDDLIIKLAQRIIALLGTPTKKGKLYEVDVRLRPEGNAGLLVSSFGAFTKYYEEQAWTWEHFALVKARMIVGSDKLIAAFEDLRSKVLTIFRDPKVLSREIKGIREKIQEQYRHKRQDLKVMPGGLADIDFIVQYVILRNAPCYPHLLIERSSIKNLSQLGDYHLIKKEEEALLLSAYHHYQSYLKRKLVEPALQMSNFIEISIYQEKVQQLWLKYFEGQ